MRALLLSCFVALAVIHTSAFASGALGKDGASSSLVAAHHELRFHLLSENGESGVVIHPSAIQVLASEVNQSFANSGVSLVPTTREIHFGGHVGLNSTVINKLISTISESSSGDFVGFNILVIPSDSAEASAFLSEFQFESTTANSSVGLMIVSPSVREHYACRQECETLPRDACDFEALACSEELAAIMISTSDISSGERSESTIYPLFGAEELLGNLHLQGLISLPTYVGENIAESKPSTLRLSATIGPEYALRDAMYLANATSAVRSKASANAVVRGDINNDGAGPDLADLVLLAGYLFRGESAPVDLKSADFDRNNIIDKEDFAQLMKFLYQKPNRKRDLAF